jgi:ribosomal protein S27AE
MSKTKQKNKSELEVLRGENRKLRSENKKLRREIKDLQKRAHFYEEVVDEVVKDAEVKTICKNCGKGQILSYDLGRLRLDKCSICDFEKKTKKGLNE